MSHVFPRHMKTHPPKAVAGDGCYLIDAAGKRYFDGSGGAAVSCLGHSDAGVRKAVKDQIDKLAFAHTGFFTSDPAEELADMLAARAPGGLGRVYFVSGGSEAVEAALKLARQYYLEIGQPDRRHIIARKQSYHGNTLGALAAGGNEWRREPFAPLLIETTLVPACYAYRGQAEGESLEEYGRRTADELEAAILKLGPETVMCFIAETVGGATAGAITPAPGYFARIREICDKYGVLLILDEVMCGMGRTGSLFACEQEGISPDIVTIAKGLGAGYQPIGAMLCSNEIYGAIEHGTGFFQHGHTYLGHAAAAACGVAVLKAFEERDLIANVRDKGAKLRVALESEVGQHPHVGDIRGRGLFLGVEFVVDRATKAPFDPSLGIAGKLKKAAFEAGLICYPMSGTIDGRRGDHVLLAPPFIMDDTHVDEIVTKLSTAMAQVLP
ncbi:aspartate aminotransferase family protein [Marimonas arenosa]|uniref:Aspartate aminotransferase family protein n=1 Tax=Marimonas arenosa TaxID=1795305 RepID=A0AAE4B4H7_9RHOB|nr:aspartate aminotransferase family protein [Marimonas arenosa]MDQ2090232.1 aspartate aminotransferase family protein [Marimonas arenosa]